MRFLHFLKFYRNKLHKMGNTFVANLIYSNLTFIFNNLNVIMTYYQFLAANKNTQFWKLSLVTFLRFWLFEPHFLTNLQLFIKKRSTLATRAGYVFIRDGHRRFLRVGVGLQKVREITLIDNEVTSFFTFAIVPS